MTPNKLKLLAICFGGILGATIGSIYIHKQNKEIEKMTNDCVGRTLESLKWGTHNKINKETQEIINRINEKYDEAEKELKKYAEEHNIVLKNEES